MLQYLATHPGRLVTKTELRQHIWAGTHVTETVLRVCIREIRVALADAAAAPQYLQTVGRQGYQWLVSGDGAAFPQAVQRTDLKLFLPYCLALLAEAHGQAGQPEAGLSVLAEALMLVEATEERWWEARASGTRPGR